MTTFGFSAAAVYFIQPAYSDCCKFVAHCAEVLMENDEIFQAQI